MKYEVWIVEMWNPEKRRWEPTVGCGLSRAEGRLQLKKWKENNPYDKFRLKRYAVVS